MPLTQLKITKFFKPAKLPEHVRQLRKARKAKAKLSTERRPTAILPVKKPAAPKPRTSERTEKYVPPHKRTQPLPSKLKPQAEAKKRPSAPLATKPAKPDTPKKSAPGPTPTTSQNSAILAHLSAHAHPKFTFPIEQQPTFATLFPGTSRPKVTMLHGNPTINKDTFNTLLKSRIAAAHTVLRTAKLDRPRLPKIFVSQQIHLIQRSLRQPKKVKKEVSSPPQEKKGKATAKPNPAEPSDKKQKQTTFVSSNADEISSSDKPKLDSSLTPEQQTLARLRSSEIQTSETTHLHDAIFTLRSMRKSLNKLKATGTITDQNGSVTFATFFEILSLTATVLEIPRTELTLAIDDITAISIESYFDRTHYVSGNLAQTLLSRLDTLVALATSL